MTEGANNHLRVTCPDPGKPRSAPSEREKRAHVEGLDAVRVAGGWARPHPNSARLDDRRRGWSVELDGPQPGETNPTIIPNTVVSSVKRSENKGPDGKGKKVELYQAMELEYIESSYLGMKPHPPLIEAA